MKRISTLAAILLLTVAFMGCTDDTAKPAGDPPGPEDTSNEASQMELDINHVAFGIEGMT